LEASASDLRVGFAGCKIALFRSQLPNFILFAESSLLQFRKRSKFLFFHRSHENGNPGFSSYLQILERWFRKKLQNARRAKTEEGSALHPGRRHDEVKAQRRR